MESSQERAEVPTLSYDAELESSEQGFLTSSLARILLGQGNICFLLYQVGMRRMNRLPGSEER